MLQRGGTDGLDIERIASIDESEKKLITLSDLQQTVNEQGRARARICTNDFRNRAFAQAAIGCSIKNRNTDLSASKSGQVLEAFRQKVAQIDNLPAGCHSKESHDREICSSERSFIAGERRLLACNFRQLAENESFFQSVRQGCRTQQAGSLRSPDSSPF